MTICMRTDCTARATKRVGFKVWADVKIYGPHKPLQATSTLLLCDEHGLETVAAGAKELFGTDGLKAMKKGLDQMFAGKAPPDWDSAQLVLLDIGADLAPSTVQ
ncbi:MAG: hypothetical protein WC729_29175 [Sphingomonas sp.]|jgi:hypothetical protein|uniref:hypothetical protein n=1 Tax=Sphingomonas sp. TaxID=28214 RepID=UPI00356A178A